MELVSDLLVSGFDIQGGGIIGGAVHEYDLSINGSFRGRKSEGGRSIEFPLYWGVGSFKVSVHDDEVICYYCAVCGLDGERGKACIGQKYGAEA